MISTYDLLGCTYNAPAAYAPGVFESCEGDLQDEVGTYTANGTSEYLIRISNSYSLFSLVSYCRY